MVCPYRYESGAFKIHGVLVLFSWNKKPKGFLAIKEKIRNPESSVPEKGSKKTHPGPNLHLNHYSYTSGKFFLFNIPHLPHPVVVVHFTNIAASVVVE